MITLMETLDSYIYLYTNLKNNAESSWEDMHKIVFTSGAGGRRGSKMERMLRGHSPVQLCGITPCTDVFPSKNVFLYYLYIVFRNTSVLKRQ